MSIGKKRLVLLIGGAAIVIGALFVFLPVWAPTPVLVPEPVAPVIAPASTLAEVAAKATSTPVASARQAAMSAPSRSTEHATTPSRSATYEASDDLDKLVPELTAAAAAAGDGEASWILSLIHAECASYAKLASLVSQQSSPFDIPGFDKLTGQQQAEVRAHQQRLEQRCKRLMTKFGSKEAFLLAMGFLTQAAEQGDLVAIATTKEGIFSLADPDGKELMRRIIRSKNPAAIAAMAGSIVDVDDTRNLMGPYSGLPEDGIAWRLVACDLGQNCGSSGAERRLGCLIQGACQFDNDRERLRALAPPELFALAEQKEREILELLARGEVETIFP